MTLLPAVSDIKMAVTFLFISSSLLHLMKRRRASYTVLLDFKYRSGVTLPGARLKEENFRQKSGGSVEDLQSALQNPKLKGG
jgi:hypothetical protein